MINRVAEIFYWIGRYTERVANHSRLINVSYHSYREWSSNEQELQQLWQRILHVLGEENEYNQHFLNDSPENVLKFLAFDQTNENSVLSCLFKARDNVRAVRERLPSRMWEAINEAYIWLKQKDSSPTLPHAFFRKTKNYMALFHGIAECTMPRMEEWYLMQIGRYIERAENTTRILQLIYLDLTVGDKNTVILDPYNKLTANLRAIDGLESFRRIHANQINIKTVANFIITNPYFPRSIIFAFNSLSNNLPMVYPVTSDHGRPICELTQQIHATLTGIDQNNFTPEQMPAFLNQILQACNNLSWELSRTFYR